MTETPATPPVVPVVAPATPAATVSTGKTVTATITLDAEKVAAKILGGPSQTRHPWRATLRTALAGVIGAASLAPDVLAAAHVNSTVLGVQAIAVAAAVTRIIAIPGVNALLTKVGLGAEPKS